MVFMNKLVEKTPDGYEITSQTAKAVHDICYVLGMKEQKAGNILAVGIPMMTIVAADDERVRDRLYAASRQTGRSKTKHRKFATKDYFDTFGEKGRPLSAAIAEQTGDSVGDVNVVMALYLPTFLDAIEEENPPGEEALGDLLHEDAEEIQSESPELVVDG